VPTTKPSGKEYVVTQGDTCADIAGSYGVSVSALIQLNRLDADCTTLQIGQKLQIP
jgi:LysM repeat protein